LRVAARRAPAALEAELKIHLPNFEWCLGELGPVFDIDLGTGDARVSVEGNQDLNFDILVSCFTTGLTANRNARPAPASRILAAKSCSSKPQENQRNSGLEKSCGVD